MKLITCVSCEDEFDPHSSAKRKSGGLYNHCPDCSEETTVKYAGVQAADGKQAQATILKFESEKDKNSYISFWKNASGYHKGKNGSQISKTTSTTPKINFKTIVAHEATNHKGKL